MFFTLVGRVGTLNVTHYTQCELRAKPRLRTLLQLADTIRVVVHESAVVHYAIVVWPSRRFFEQPPVC